MNRIPFLLDENTATFYTTTSILNNYAVSIRDNASGAIFSAFRRREAASMIKNSSVLL